MLNASGVCLYVCIRLYVFVRHTIHIRIVKILKMDVCFSAVPQPTLLYGILDMHWNHLVLEVKLRGTSI